MVWAAEAKSGDPTDGGIKANRAGQKDGPRTDDVCTKGECIDGIVLQQS